MLVLFAYLKLEVLVRLNKFLVMVGDLAKLLNQILIFNLLLLELLSQQLNLVELTLYLLNFVVLDRQFLLILLMLI